MPVARVDQLIDDSLQKPEDKLKLKVRASEVFRTLIDAGVVEIEEDENGDPDYYVTMDLPEDFALDQPLSPFLLAALELLDPESETYTYDIISMVEATLEDPRQVLRAQERKAKDAAIAAMKADGVEYEERLDRIAEVTYPRPLRELLFAAFDKYCESVPWARDYYVRPKSVLRDMLESAADFKGYIQKLGIMRYEGALLRYLSEAYRALDRTLPFDKRSEEMEDIIAWLGLVVRSVDSSLVDEWEQAGQELDARRPRQRMLWSTIAVASPCWCATPCSVECVLLRQMNHEALGEADVDNGFPAHKWRAALDEYYDVHEDVLVDADARSMAFLAIDESDEDSEHVWHVQQTFSDPDGDHDFAIRADVDLDATQEGDGVVFKDYRVGFIEDLL